MVLDFTEIPKANEGGGLQDTFELFARDFLSYLGYNIVSEPDRGADGKKDMIVEETINGISSTIKMRWLVSCKHYAHSGNSVKDSDEINILERVSRFKCNGFMGVYSTVCSTGLSGTLDGVRNNNISVQIYEREKIESLLLGKDFEGLRIAARYMGKSYSNYRLENPIPATIFGDQRPLKCDCCGKDICPEYLEPWYCLLRKESDADNENEYYDDLFICCRKNCGDALERRKKSIGLVNVGWNDVHELTNPSIWICRMMAFLNSVAEGEYSKSCIEKMKQILLSTYPYVARHLTHKEQIQVKQFLQSGLI